MSQVNVLPVDLSKVTELSAEKHTLNSSVVSDDARFSVLVERHISTEQEGNHGKVAVDKSGKDCCSEQQTASEEFAIERQTQASADLTLDAEQAQIVLTADVKHQQEKQTELVQSEHFISLLTSAEKILQDKPVNSTEQTVNPQEQVLLAKTETRLLADRFTKEVNQLKEGKVTTNVQQPSVQVDNEKNLELVEMTFAKVTSKSSDKINQVNTSSKLVNLADDQQGLSTATRQDSLIKLSAKQVIDQPALLNNVEGQKTAPSQAEQTGIKATKDVVAVGEKSLSKLVDKNIIDVSISDKVKNTRVQANNLADKPEKNLTNEVNNQVKPVVKPNENTDKASLTKAASDASLVREQVISTSESKAKTSFVSVSTKQKVEKLGASQQQVSRLIEQAAQSTSVKFDKPQTDQKEKLTAVGQAKTETLVRNQANKQAVISQKVDNQHSDLSLAKALTGEKYISQVNQLATEQNHTARDNSVSFQQNYALDSEEVSLDKTQSRTTHRQAVNMKLDGQILTEQVIVKGKEQAFLTEEVSQIQKGEAMAALDNAEASLHSQLKKSTLVLDDKQQALFNDKTFIKSNTKLASAMAEQLEKQTLGLVGADTLDNAHQEKLSQQATASELVKTNVTNKAADVKIMAQKDQTSAHLVVESTDNNADANTDEQGQYRGRGSEAPLMNFVAEANKEEARLNSFTMNKATTHATDVSGQATTVPDSAIVEHVLDNAEGVRLTESIKPAVSNVQSLNQSLAVFRKDFSEAVKEKVMVMISQKLQQFDIRLDPPELGSVHAKINLQNEQAVVNFIVQNNQAKEAFEQNFDKLKEMLAESGVELGGADVEQQQTSSDNEENKEAEQLPHGQQGTEKNSANEQFSSAHLLKNTADGVDYYA